MSFLMKQMSFFHTNTYVENLKIKKKSYAQTDMLRSPVSYVERSIPLLE